MRHIALLGASGSGKTWLAQRLARALTGTADTFQISDAPALGTLPGVTVLLMGLDLRQPSPAQSASDQALRQALAHQAQAFQVIYGQGEERLANALQALQVTGQPSQPTDSNMASEPAPAKRKPWVWACEKCSDPVCEHRLLSDLLASR